MMETAEITSILDELIAAQPRDRRAILLAHGDPEELLHQLCGAAGAMLTVNVSRAKDAGAMLVTLSDEVGSSRSRAAARRMVAQAHAYAGEFDEVLRTCAEGIVLAESHGELVEAARLRLASIQAHALRANFDDAIAAGETAWQVFTTHDEPALAGRADLNLGVIHRMADRLEKAVEHFDRARSALAAEPLILAQLQSNRGEVLFDLDRLEEAEEAFVAALELFREHDQHWAAAIAEGNLADLATRQGLFHRALHHFENARALMESDETPTHLARLLIEQADVKASIGMTADAAKDYAEAISVLDRQSQPADASRGRVGYARLLLRTGNTSHAMDEIADAMNDLEALDNPHALAMAQLVQAASFLQTGWTEEARELARRAALALSDRPIAFASAQLLVAAIELKAGCTEESAVAVDVALDVVERLGVSPIAAEALHLRGRIHEAAHRLDAAESDYMAAVERCDRVRGALQADQFRQSFLADRLSVYEDCLALFIESEKVEQALSAAERCRSRALLDLIRGAADIEWRDDQTNPDADPILSDLHRARARLNSAYVRLAECDNAGTSKNQHSKLSVLEAEVEGLESRVSAKRGMADLLSEPSSLADITRSLSKGEALVEYTAARGMLHAIIVMSDSTAIFRNLIELEELDQLVHRFQFQIGRAVRPGALEGSRADRMIEASRKSLRALDAAILEPVRAHLSSIQRLVIIPHGVLHSIPFPALWSGSHYLIEQFTVTTSPSASVFVHSVGRGKPRTEAGRSVVFAVADENAPKISTEATAISERLHADLITGEAATVQEVVERAQDADILHLACHGRFLAGNPLSSGLRLADRWFTVRDACRLRTRASLITLSGCETGSHRLASGDEIIGLIRVLIAAGARSLAVSLWTVNDCVTTDLMYRFYDNICDTESSDFADALRRAQLDTVREFPHPAMWAPFILIGAS